MGLFDVFKDKDEDENSGGMAEETPSFESEPQPEETVLREATEMKLLPQSLLKKQPHIHKLELQYKVSLE